MITYKILVKDKEGVVLGEFDKFKDLKLGKRLNNYGECSFQIPVNDPKAASLIALRVYTIWVYRDGLLLWAGEQVSRSSKLEADGDNWATITCYDWLEQLNSRQTVAEVVYNFQDGSEIVKNLIATTQADVDGALGIVEGTIEPTTFREKTYTNQNIMDAIISLANLSDGFDFEITNQKVLNIKNFIGVDRSDSIFIEYGVNTKSMQVTEDFSKPATRAIVLGQTGDIGDSLRIERNDAVNRAIYGLREQQVSQLEQSEMEAFESTGDAMLRKYGAPIMKLSMDILRSTTPTIADFALGDIIRVKIKRGIYNINEAFRVFGWTVNYDEDNTETLALTVGNFNLGDFS